jgi:trans-aconitate 2-methyltransferase
MSDWDAERYHRLSNPQLGWGRHVLERLAPDPNERILDLGCGTGRLTAELFAAMNEGLVVAVDRSESMLRQVSTQALWHRGPHPIDTAKLPTRIHIVRADGMHLPFVDAFDAVLSTATFHWIPDHLQLFSSIYRALVPGGRLVAQCGGAGNLEALLERSSALMRQPALRRYFEGWRDPWVFADVATTTARLDAAGFSAIDVSLVEAPTTLPDRPTYRDFLGTVCVREHVARLPPSEAGRFLDALADQAGGDDPPYTLDYWRLNILARKPAGIERAA